MKFSKLLCTTACISCLSSPVYADDTLTGNWGGARDTLSEAGVDVELTYKADVWGNISGGEKKGSRFLDNLDAIMTVDGGKLFNSPGTTMLVHLLNNDGGEPDGDLVGSAQGIDNIEVGTATGKLYQAWIQQNAFDDKLSVLAGLYDLNSEFYVTDSSLLFLHSTYGIGTEVSQTGVNGPSIFPFTSAGVRVRVNPTDNTYIQAVALDGVPGDPNDPHGTHIDFNSGDGLLWVGEAGYTFGNSESPTGKLAFGGWYYTTESDDVDSNKLTKHHNNGVYMVGEHQLYHTKDGKDLTGFIHFGFADKDVNQFDYAWSTGLVYTGLIPGRDDSQLGFGVAGAHSSSKYRDASLVGGTRLDVAETALELTYRDSITPWMAIQPDVQYIINPGTDKTLNNATVIGTRLEISF